MVRKTPGVYISHKKRPETEIGGIESAIPAFIGYTEKALDTGGNDLTAIPTRIGDLDEFTQLFGGSYTADSFFVYVDSSQDNHILDVKVEKRFYLFDSLQLYFDNGGRDCFIVSIGSYEDPISLEDDTDPRKGFSVGLRALFKVDEPTLLVFPDAVAMKDGDDQADVVSLGELQKQALDQCRQLKDRFVIMDLANGHQPIGPGIESPIDIFRDQLGNNSLMYGAAYYPWLYSTLNHPLKFRHLSFREGISIESAQTIDKTRQSLEFLSGSGPDREMVNSVFAAIKEVNEIIVCIEAEQLEYTNFQLLYEHFKSMLQTVLTMLDVPDDQLKQEFGPILAVLRSVILAFVKLGTSQASLTRNNVARIRQKGDLTAPIWELIALEKNAGILGLSITPRLEADVNADYQLLNGTGWLVSPDPSVGTFPYEVAQVAASDAIPPNMSTADIVKLALAQISVRVEPIMQALIDVFGVALDQEKATEQNLFQNHPFFIEIGDIIDLKLKLMPTSGAVAGAYVATDEKRGVWKAPANIKLESVIGPVIELDNRDQESLNVHTTGKSINAIRTFVGRGTLIWGARTLDGNSLEWRYVPVRRFFSFAEESIKKALEPYVFESNSANTWEDIKFLISNFLTIQWRQGALTGARPAEAYFVNVGLGETMTQLDILEGRMIVEIGLAVSRPLEFITLLMICNMEEA